jgi:hypothetical protein
MTEEGFTWEDTDYTIEEAYNDSFRLLEKLVQQQGIVLILSYYFLI